MGNIKEKCDKCKHVNLGAYCMDKNMTISYYHSPDALECKHFEESEQIINKNMTWEEVITALREGKKCKQHHWRNNAYIMLGVFINGERNKILDEKGKAYSPFGYCITDDWEIYEEPKKDLKERIEEYLNNTTPETVKRKASEAFYIHPPMCYELGIVVGAKIIQDDILKIIKEG